MYITKDTPLLGVSLASGSTTPYLESIFINLLDSRAITIDYKLIKGRNWTNYGGHWVLIAPICLTEFGDEM